MMIDQNATCPACGKSDKAEKVSGIVRNRVTVYGEYGVHQVNNLAKEFEPPEKPKANCACIVLLGIFSFPLLVGLYVLSAGREGISIMTQTGLLLLGLVILTVIFMIRQSNAKMPHWERAMDKWNQLYYCHHNDVLFNPNDPASGFMEATRKNMLDYIYNETASRQKPISVEKTEEQKIIIKCENCGQKLSIPLRRENLHVACPKCKHEFNYEFIEGNPVND